LKKKISMLLSVILCVSMFTITGVSAKNGDVIGHTVYTDIVAYINHYPIQSYNMDGYTVVIAEDLANYGFNVSWNADSKRINITRNSSATAITPYGTLYQTRPSQVGKKAEDVLSTDITAYVNGSYVNSYNVGGKTVIRFEDLSPYGEVDWVPDVRAIKMWINDLPVTDYAPLPEAPVAPTGIRAVISAPGVTNECCNSDDKSLIELAGFKYYTYSDQIYVQWAAQNISGRTIESYALSFYMYDDAGNPVYDEFTGSNKLTTHISGPIAPDAMISAEGTVGYSYDCTKIVLGQMDINYTDGTTDSGWYGYWAE